MVCIIPELYFHPGFINSKFIFDILYLNLLSTIYVFFSFLNPVVRKFFFLYLIKESMIPNKLYIIVKKAA